MEPRLKGMRILVVDDNAINRKLAVTMLARAGAEVASADSGEECLTIMNDGSFDLVLMDIEMPGLNGFETAQAIRTDKSSDELTILAFSASLVTNMESRCENAGMNGFLSKPIHMEALISTLERFGSRSRQAPPAPE
jgi:CheY-like chemotaxis protein